MATKGKKITPQQMTSTSQRLLDQSSNGRDPIAKYRLGLLVDLTVSHPGGVNEADLSETEKLAFKEHLTND